MPEREQVRTKTELMLQKYLSFATIVEKRQQLPLVVHSSASPSIRSIFVAVEAFFLLWSSIRARSQLSPSTSFCLSVSCSCLKVTWSSAVPLLPPAWASSLSVFGCGPGCLPNVCSVRLQLDLTLCDWVWLGGRSECEGSRLSLTF